MANTKRKCGGCGNRFPVETMTIYGLSAYCSPECRKPAKAPKKPAKAKKKPKSIASMRNDVAELVQRLVRLKAADSQGMCKCWTCDTVKHWKEMQGGHFIERGKTATKMLEENIHPQCPSCNQWGMKKASTVLIYRAAMVDMYGEDFVKWLEAEAKKVVRHTRQELQALIGGYKRQIAQLEGVIP